MWYFLRKVWRRVTGRDCLFQLRDLQYQRDVLENRVGLLGCELELEMLHVLYLTEGEQDYEHYDGYMHLRARIHNCRSELLEQDGFSDSNGAHFHKEWYDEMQKLRTRIRGDFRHACFVSSIATRPWSMR